MQKLFAALASVVLFVPYAAVHAQAYPARPIRFVIPFGPGQVSDRPVVRTGRPRRPAAGSIVACMNKEMTATLAKASVRDPMLKQGFIPRSSTPEALTACKWQLVTWQSTKLPD